MSKQKFAQNDFLEENLPQTRKEQFFDLLKNQYKAIFLVGLTMLLFFLPSLVKNCLADYANIAAYDLLEAGTYTEAQTASAVAMIWLVSNSVDVVLYPLIFLGFAGIMRVLKQLIYGESIVFKYDFKIGIKDNWKPFVLTGLIIALIKGVINVLASSSDIVVIKYGFLLIFAVGVLPALIMICFYTTVYKNNYLTSLKHSYFIFLRTSWKSLGLMIIFLAPYILLEYLLNFIYVKQGIYAILIVFGLPLALLISFLIIMNFFDEIINIHAYPETVRKGLYVSEKEKEEIAKRVKAESENGR